MGSGELSFRRARADERDLLDDMTLAGLRHWGHDVAYPDAYAGLAAMLRAESGPEHHLVFVLEENDAVAGFYELRDRGDHIELLRMFLRTELIGRGRGRVLWDDAIRRAGRTHDRMLIVADPGAAGLYRAMGATLEGRVEASPGFLLSRFWFDLRTK